MKLGAIALMFVVPLVIDPGTPNRSESTTWLSLGDELADLQASLAGAEALLAKSRGNEWRWKQCRFQSLQHGTWTAREERLTAECVTKKWPVPGGLSTLSRVVSCESGWYRKAYNGAGPYVGLGQVSDWSTRFHVFKAKAWRLSPNWTNSRSMLTVVARWAHASGWSAWSCY